VIAVSQLIQVNPDTGGMEYSPPDNFIVLQGSAWWVDGDSHLMAAAQFNNNKGFDWECAVDVEPWDDLTGPDGSPMELTYNQIVELCQGVRRGQK
jgi:hypothetical protein